MPADHPPVGATINQGENPNAPVPQITEAIERAKNNPNDFEMQMTAADLYYQIQRFEDAAKFYEQANKINPDSKITGSINPIREIIIAVCCVAEIVEIKIPNANAEMINKMLSKPSKNKLP